jgi:uncharacterized RDD family membrane protein YckC
VSDHHPQNRPGLLRRAITQPVSAVADAVVPALVDAVDLNQTLGRVDVNDLADRVDVDELLSRVDLDELLSRVDVDALLDRIDLDRVLDRVDLQRLIDRVDVESVIDRVDVNALVNRVDLDKVLESVDIDALLARSTGGMFKRFIDLIRRMVVGLDIISMRIIDRFRLHKDRPRPLGPQKLVSEAGTSGVSGRYAGPVTRLLAFAIDVGVVLGLFGMLTALVTYLVKLVSGYQLSDNSIWWTIALLAFAFLYGWVGLTVSGRTIGKWILGLRVMATDGSTLPPHSAPVRMLALPLSFILLIGLIMGVVDRRGRTLHDLIAHTCVVYDWGDRRAEMPGPLHHFLARRGALEVR